MSELNNSDHDAIWNIMNNFDFERTHKVMNLLKWEWYTPDKTIESGQVIPDIQTIRDTARTMLVEGASRARKVSGQYSIASGGFFVYADYDAASNRVFLKLAFELTNWDNYE